MAASPLPRLRKLCLALPEAHEVEAWGEPTFRVRNKIFATYASASNHHGRGRNATWVKAAPGEQAAMVAARPIVSSSPRMSAPAAGSASGSTAWSTGVTSPSFFAILIGSWRRKSFCDAARMKRHYTGRDGTLVQARFHTRNRRS